jgi:hypothetical protein
VGDKIADLLPPWARRVIYVTLGTATALEAIWDLVPAVLEGKVLLSLTVLGFGLATSQTK